MKIALIAVCAAMGLVGLASAALAENAPGVTATEIKIGQTMPYSGPASAYSVLGKVEVAYFNMLSEQGGINGRKVMLLSRDDGYQPAKAIEQVRKLIEQDQVAFIFSSLGTPSNLAIRKYLNDKKIPQLFVASGADIWGDPQHYPWTIGLLPSYRVESAIDARYVDKTKPGAKVAFLYQNDPAGKEFLSGLMDVWGAGFSKHVVKAESYEVSDPTIDSAIVSLQASGANVLITAATPKFGAMAIRKVAQLGWHPSFIVSYVMSSVAAVLTPAGLDNSVGLITAQFSKDPTDPRWKDDPGLNAWRAFMTKYLPDVSLTDNNAIVGYMYAETLARVLKQCGNDLSRANIMKQATHLKGLHVDVLLPDVTIDTSPTNYHPIHQMQLSRFDGRSWVLFGDVISAN
ncbi:MAG TPA: ABC transporter substrate-binding protein [Rhizomicrobium sp.]|jgi:branched-chain amino acid transport system substrate-binding protein|nr:ABC transporter substrate-binding protein [Rhizomicrobium sp.]